MKKQTKIKNHREFRIMSKERIRCADCGKFISYQDLENGKAKSNFTPDSELSIERIWFQCEDCYCRDQFDSTPVF